VLRQASRAHVPTCFLLEEFAASKFSLKDFPQRSRFRRGARRARALRRAGPDQHTRPRRACARRAQFAKLPDDLGNTPAILPPQELRHETVGECFESGVLEAKFA